MTNENQNTEHPRLVRVKCLKNFNLEGRQGMFIHGTEQEITEKEVEFLQKMGLTSQPFIEIIDPDYNKPAPQPVAAAPVTWTQTHGGKGIGGPVVAGLDAPVNTAPAEPAKDPEPVAAGPDAPEDPESEPAKESTKPRLNLKKK
jgi:hypothetical protein